MCSAMTCSCSSVCSPTLPTFARSDSGRPDAGHSDQMETLTDKNEDDGKDECEFLPRRFHG